MFSLLFIMEIFSESVLADATCNTNMCGSAAGSMNPTGDMSGLLSSGSNCSTMPNYPMNRLNNTMVGSESCMMGGMGMYQNGGMSNSYSRNGFEFSGGYQSNGGMQQGDGDCDMTILLGCKNGGMAPNAGGMYMGGDFGGNIQQGGNMSMGGSLDFSGSNTGMGMNNQMGGRFAQGFCGTPQGAMLGHAASLATAAINQTLMASAPCKPMHPQVKTAIIGMNELPIADNFRAVSSSCANTTPCYSSNN